MDVLICGKYTIHVDDHHILDGDGSPFLPFLQGNSARIRQLARFTWCWEKLVQYVKSCDYHVNTVVEYFGGMGRSAVIIQNELHPKNHVLYEFNAGCYEHLVKLSNNFVGMEVRFGDSYNLSKCDAADFAVFDIPTMTIQAFYDVDRAYLINALNKIFITQPRFVQIADTALGYLHFHRERWKKLIGISMETPADYIMAMSREFERHYGYHITFASHYGRLSALLLESVNKQTIILDARSDENSANYLRIM